MRKDRGFTLIELILVIGLLVTLGAVAAPVFQSVFENSKEDLEQLQMTQVLLAYQEAVLEGFEGNSDLSEEERFQIFLNEQKNNATWLEVMDSPCCVSGTGCVADNYKGMLDGERFYLVCNACGLQSKDSITSEKLRQEVIDYTYLDEVNFETGTWLIIGDDENLRQDYFTKLKVVPERDYQMETKFQIIDGKGIWPEDEPSEPDDGLVKFEGRDYPKAYVYNIAGDEYALTVQFHKRNGYDDWSAEQDLLEGQWVWSKKSRRYVWEETPVLFNVNQWDAVRVRAYRVNEYGYWEIEKTTTYRVWYEGQGNHASFHCDLWNATQTQEMNFYTGQIFNYYGEPGSAEYDFFGFKMKKNKKVVLNLYHVDENNEKKRVTAVQEDIAEWDFSYFFNEKRVMFLEMKNNRVSFSLDGERLVDKLRLSNTHASDSLPAVGYYMGPPVKGSGLPSEFELKEYPTPFYMQLLEMPIIGEESQIEKPEPPRVERLGTEHITINPIEFRVTSSEEKAFVIHLNLPGGKSKVIMSRMSTFSVDQSGEIEAYLEVDGIQSSHVILPVENIIEPFDELNGVADNNGNHTILRFDNLQNGMEENYWRIQEEIQTLQEEYQAVGFDDEIWIETKDNRGSYKITHLNNWGQFLAPRKMNLNKIELYVVSEYGELLNPIAYIVRPESPSDILFQQYWGGEPCFKIVGTGIGRDRYQYRWKNEEGEVIREWTDYPNRGSSWVDLENKVALVEARTVRNHVHSLPIEKGNPYFVSLNMPLPQYDFYGCKKGEVRLYPVESGLVIAISKNDSPLQVYNRSVKIKIKKRETVKVYSYDWKNRICSENYLELTDQIFVKEKARGDENLEKQEVQPVQPSISETGLAKGRAYVTITSQNEGGQIYYKISSDPSDLKTLEDKNWKNLSGEEFVRFKLQGQKWIGAYVKVGEKTSPITVKKVTN